MANKYWAAGVSGNWNNILSWSDFATGTPAGALVPGAGDAAIFNAASGTVTATLDISPDVQTLTMTGFTGTLAFGTNTISLNSTGTVFTGATTMTVTGTPQIICTDSSAITRIITPTAVTEANSISFRVTAGTGAVTTTGGAYRNLDFTDGVNPTGFAGIISSNSITVYGNLKASTGMLVTAGTAVITFAATSGTKTIDTAGVTFDRPFAFNGVGGTFQLASALTSGATRTTTLTAGTLDLAGYTLTTGLFSSSNSNTRVIAFGTGKIVLIATSGTIFTTSTATGLTVTGTNPLIQATAGGAGTRSITIGTVGEANAISVDVTSGSDIISLGTTSGSYKNVDFTGFTGTVSVGNSILVFGNWNYGGTTIQGVGAGTVTFSATSGTKTITSNGFSFPGNVTFNGVGGTFQLQDALTSGATRTCTLTNGTLDLASYTLTIGLFSSSNSNTRVLAFGTGKMVLTGLNTTVYTTSTGTGLTMTGTRTIEVTGVGLLGDTRVISGAQTAAGGVAANAANFYIQAGADTISLGTANRVYGTLNFTGFSGSTLGDIAPQIYGDLVLSSTMTVAGGTNFWVFLATTSQSITTSGVTINNPITFDGIGGSWAMQDALTLGSTRALTMTNGTLQLKAGTTNTVGSIATSGTNQKFLQSTTPGTQATLSDASGTNTVSYLTIQDSNATGGAVFQAFTSNLNVDSGNNTGWKFNNAGGSFLMFF